MLPVLSRVGVAAAAGAALVTGTTLLLSPMLHARGLLPSASVLLEHVSQNALSYGGGTLAVGALLVALVAVSRPARSFPLTTAALVGAGAEASGLSVALSSGAAEKLVRYAAYRVPGVYGCLPKLRLGRRGWVVDIELQVSLESDIADVAAAFEAEVRRSLRKQTHMEVARVSIRATFEPVETDRLR